jgi:alginate O-acetyltransferase complex protein AlgI
MLFNSFAFLLVFLPLTAIAYGEARARSRELAWAVLLTASLIFYSWWDWRFTGLLVTGVVVNHVFGRALARRRTRTLLAVGIVGNLLPLLAFKYLGWLAGMVGSPIQSLVLPLGISFFTFLQVGYLVDLYRGATRDRGLLPYAVFVCYFPHLLAGPILRHEEIARQLDELPRTRLVLDERFALGLQLLIVGLFKKVVVADMLWSGLADDVFANAQSANFIEAWTGVLAYTAQLYFDFSGYCEMALGMSLMLGLSIPINFRSPYRALDITDFWRRWHITLGAWFRDHVYIPLGGSRSSTPAFVVAIAVTFLLTGLWHGAAWTFVAWGALHAAFLLVQKAWQSLRRPVPDWLARVLTIACVAVAWVLFRATSVEDALALWRAMAGVHGLALGPGFAGMAAWLPQWLPVQPSHLVTGAEILLLAVLLGWCATASSIHERPIAGTRRELAVLGAMCFVAVLALNRTTSFIYFNW